MDSNVLEVDGVSVLSFPSDDEVCRASLIIAVGERDETPPTLGVLHAIEHLVMRSVRETAAEVNAAVDEVTTYFDVTGSPEVVSRFLERICVALNDPPVEDLPAEAKVLAAELADIGRPVAALHRARYGNRDLGLIDVEGPGPEGITAEMVRATAERWVVTGNALVVIDGPLPDDLRLPLRAGAPPPRAWPMPRTWSRPTALTVDGPACVVNLLLPPTAQPGLRSVVIELIENRLTEAVRHEAGLSYVVDTNVLPTAAGMLDVTVHAEPPESTAVAAITTMVSALSALAGSGASRAEVGRAVERVREGRRGRQAAMERAVRHRIDQLLGFPSEPDVEVPALEQDTVNSYLAEVLSAPLFLFDSRAEEALSVLGIDVIMDAAFRPGELPAGTVYTPPLLARMLNREARQARVALTERGLALSMNGQIQTLDWNDVVGVLRDEDDLEVYAADGAAIPVGPGLYRAGDELVAAVTANVPADLIYSRSKLMAEVLGED